ncbi:membrane associated rhomboid family serine protease [Desulfobaculum xiamenense]|uniref:Membrane associated rhomboid family serine protease n=1 Tax=Desulfobaculum xiamenense TaxID=995050 RepID=A0A846QQF1_9BACT|nr:rhomboid family intramembrane serine protease [Desulfobaculum xiamenense]NJB67625.1 membrane associated rhomboid family serine protease [Desulfobaculum xiamenense]
MPTTDHPDAGTPTKDRAAWVDLLDVLPDGMARRPLDGDTARDWSLALGAAEIPHRLMPLARGWRIVIRGDWAERAREEISAFANENPHPRTRRAAPRPFRSAAAWTAATVMTLGALFHTLITRPWPKYGLYPDLWLDNGRADSAAILAGQWWRTLTALTLHADAGHMLANAALGGVIMTIFCAEAGSGAGWLVFVLGGAFGNLANAAFHGPGHLSIGASTAVFAAVGALGTLRAVRDRSIDLRRTVAPVVACLGILAMLGTGGERTDLGAHAFGFLAGLPLGALTAYALPRPAATPTGADRLLGLTAFTAMASAWALAFAP